MNIASRIRHSFFRSPSGSSRNEQVEDDLLGVTDALVDHIRSFSIDTFKNFSLTDEETSSASANVNKDLSDWQEKHAVLVLSKSKELSQLRFKLCPRLLNDQQFWRIYFQLVRNLVAKYEVLAIQQDKIRRVAMEETKGVYEVEMSETRPPATPSTGLDV